MTNLDPLGGLASTHGDSKEIISGMSISPTVQTEPAKIKGEIIYNIIIPIGVGLLANAFYDLLKLAIQQYFSQVTNSDYIIFNGRKIYLKELVEKPELKELFNEDSSQEE